MRRRRAIVSSSSSPYRAVRILENYWHYMCHYMSRYARLFDPGAKSGQQGRDGDRVEKIERARDRTIAGRWPPRTRARSEEHTSELQSLLRISYDVFCLQKKETTQN